MQRVYSHENMTILSSAKNLLELNGIDCFIKNEYHASGGHVGWGAVPVELWVYNEQAAERAMSILDKELNQSTDLPDWQCKHCAEWNAATFESCWKCQEVHPA